MHTDIYLAKLSKVYTLLPAIIIPVALIVTTNFPENDFLSLYDSQRLIATIALLITLLSTWLTAKSSLVSLLVNFPKQTLYTLTSLFIIGILSTLNANDISHAALEFCIMFLLLLCTLCISARYKQNPELFQRIVLISFLILAVSQTIYAFAGYFAALMNNFPLKPHDLFRNFPNVRFFNDIQSWTLPLIILPLLIFPNLAKKYQTLILTIASCWWLLLFVSGGRATMLGIIAGTLLAIAIYKKSSLAWLKLQIKACFGGFILYGILFVIIPFALYENTLNTQLIRNTTHDRIYLWNKAWELVQGNLLIGVGPMNYACDPHNFTAAHPHNSIIQIATEWGIPAAFLFVFLFIAGIYHWVKRTTVAPPKTSDNSSKHIQVSLFAALMSGAVTSMFSGMIVMPLSQLTSIIIIGWMLGIYFSQSPTVAEPPRKYYYLIGTLALCNTIIISAAITNTLPLQNISKNQNNIEIQHYLPRFWQQGKICEYEHPPSRN